MTWTTTRRGYKTIIDMGAPNSAEVVGPNHEANARLIAAAPDLLQALHDVDAYLAPQGDEEDVYNYIRAIIKGAISKAQGA